MAKKSFLPPTLTTVTFYSKIIALFLFILFPFAGFYIGMNYQHVQDEKAAEVLPNPQPTVVPIVFPGNSLSLSLADSGKIYTVKVGTGIIVGIGSSSTHWTVKSSDPTILRSFTLGIAQRIGDPTVARFTAVKKGTAQITGEGSAACTAGKLCPHYLIHYSVTVNVR